MRTYRGHAIAAGVLFIVATVGALAGSLILRPILSTSDDLIQISANEGQVLLAAFLQFIAAVACPAIAIALYPVLRSHGEGLALGSVAFRTIEGAIYVLSVVVVLTLVSLSQYPAGVGGAGSVAIQVQGATLLAVRDQLGAVGVLTFGLGAFMYYGVFYRSRLVPRWLAAWGLLAVASVMLSAVMVMFRLIESMSAVQVVLALPIFVQEMVLAVWLMTRGFDLSAIAAEPAVGPSRWRPAAGAGTAM